MYQITSLQRERRKQANYSPLVKRQPPKTGTVQLCEDLKGCFECTDWDVFVDACGDDLDKLTDTVSCYINFCVDSVIPTKKIRSFANKKPWLTHDINRMLNEKKRAFASGDRDELKRVQKELKTVI